MRKTSLVLLVLVLPLALLSAAGTTEQTTPDVIGLSVTIQSPYELGVTRQLENRDNVITPYIMERFGLRVAEFRQIPTDMTYPQAVVMWRAANMVPDLMMSGAEGFGALVASGAFAPVDDLLEQMPNYERFLPRRYWPRETGEDGKIYAFYKLPGYEWPKQEPPINDVVTPSLSGRALWVREDVLDAIGYSYTPYAELKKVTVDVGLRPTIEQLAIDPPIDSPDAFLDMLRKIKAAGLKAADGTDVIPFSMVDWETWHLGVMFDWGYWRINRDGDVDGYLGLPGAREYLHWLWTADREGLIDPDYLVHTRVQLQEKVAIGRVAAGEWVPDANNIFAQLEQNVPGAVRHFFPFPKQSPDYGFFDTYNPHPYRRTALSRNLSQEARERIARFVDWTYSDEGANTLAWGPESAGLYQIVDGNRRFVDPAVEEAVLSGDVEGPGVYKYGLFDSFLQQAADPLTNALGPAQLHRTVFMEYNRVSNFMALFSGVVASDPRYLGVGTQLQTANSDQSELVQQVADWYWGIFPRSYLPQLLKAENEAQFNTRLDQLIEAFMRETEYADARENMVRYFDRFPPMWDN